MITFVLWNERTCQNIPSMSIVLRSRLFGLPLVAFLPRAQALVEFLTLTALTHWGYWVFWGFWVFSVLFGLFFGLTPLVLALSHLPSCIAITWPIDQPQHIPHLTECRSILKHFSVWHCVTLWQFHRSCHLKPELGIFLLFQSCWAWSSWSHSPFHFQSFPQEGESFTNGLT